MINGYTIIESDDEDYIETYDDVSTKIEDLFNFTLSETITNNENIDKYQYSIDNGVPSIFIFINEKNNIIDLTKLNDISILELYKNYGKLYDINIFNLILLFFIIHRDDNFEKEEERSEFFITSFNELKKITNYEYEVEKFGTYVYEFENKISSLLSKDKEKKEKLDQWKKDLLEIEVSKTPENIKTIKLEIVYNIEYNNQILNKEIIPYLFNDIETNKNVILVKYLDKYKVYDEYPQIEELVNYKFDEEEDFNILISIQKDIYKTKLISISINVNDSTLRFTVEKDDNEKVIEYLKDKITFKNYIIDSYNGNFNINIENFDETKLTYLINQNDIFKEILYINENTKPRSLQKKIKYYYKTINDEKYLLFFTIEKNPLYRKKYNINFKSNTINEEKITNFINIFAKLMEKLSTIDLSDTEYDIIIKPYNSGRGEGLGGNMKNKKQYNEKTLKVKEKKIENLLNKTKNIFPKSIYSRICSCPKQPIIIDEEDVEDWENLMVDGKKRNVLLFPPAESNQEVEKNYYVCPGEYTMLNFIKNPDENSDYPILPCCNYKKGKNTYYEDYDLIRSDPAKYFSNIELQRENVLRKIKTNKILNYKQYGVLDEKLNDMLKKIYKGESFVRMGLVANSKNSFIHLLIIVSEHLKKLKIDNEKEKFLNDKLIRIRDEYLNSSVIEKENLVFNFRKNIFEFCNIEYGMQENYDMSSGEIKRYINDENNDFDSMRFYRYLEYIFKINIFIIKNKFENNAYEEDYILEKPNFNNYHIRKINFELPNILILRIKNSYEIIRIEKKFKSKNTKIAFDENLALFFNDIINTQSYSIYNENYISDNKYNNINWESILAGYKVISQSINSDGRAYMLNIKDDNNEFSVFIPPSPPLNVKESYKVKLGNKSLCKRLFGNGISGDRGVWFKINGFLGVFVPCDDVSKKDYLVSTEFNINYYYKKNNLKLDEIDNLQYNSNLIKQLVLWLWNLSVLSLDEWIENYFILIEGEELLLGEEEGTSNEDGSKYKVNNILKNFKIEIPYILPPVNNTDEGLKYLSKKISYLFSRDGVLLYPDFYNKLVLYMKNYVRSTEGITKEPSKILFGAFEEDNKIISGEENFINHIYNLNSNKIDSNEILNEYSKYIKIYPYNDKNGDVYLIQNFKVGRESVAMLNTIVWNEVKYNIGYNLTEYNFWNIFKIFPSLIEFFGVDILKISEENLNIKTNDVNKAIDYLVQGYIFFEFDKKKHKGEVYEYSDGSFSSMLKIVNEK